MNMHLTYTEPKKFVSVCNEHGSELLPHPMSTGIAQIILETLEKNGYEIHLNNYNEHDKLFLVHDNIDGSEIEYTLEELLWKPTLLEITDDPLLNKANNHCRNLLKVFLDNNTTPLEYERFIQDELEKYHGTRFFDEDDNLLWNSIDYTTREWIEINKNYYEKDDSMLCLTIGDSFPDLEKKYGELHFPENAMNDGKIIFFSDQYELDSYLMELHDLLDHQAIQNYMKEFFLYDDADLIVAFNPGLDLAAAQFIAQIAEDQGINVRSHTSLENIISNIDMNELSQDERQQVEYIKQNNTLKVTSIEVTKELFDTFFNTLSEQSKEQVSHDLENIRGKGLYIYSVSPDYHVVLSQRDGEKFCVHNVYGSDSGLEHGSYDIASLEAAEKVVLAKLASYLEHEPNDPLYQYDVIDKTSIQKENIIEVQRHQFDSFYAKLPSNFRESVQDSFDYHQAVGVYAYHLHNLPFNYMVVGQTNEEKFVGWDFHIHGTTMGFEQITEPQDTLESAQSLVMDYMIDWSTNNYVKHEIVDYIADATEEEFYRIMREDLKAIFEHYNKYTAGKDDKIELVDLKAYQFGQTDGKVKVLVEFKGDLSEDALFNILHDKDIPGHYSDGFTVNGVDIDLNPIKEEKSGTIAQYLNMLERIQKNEDKFLLEKQKKQEPRQQTDSAVDRYFEQIRDSLGNGEVTIKQVLHAAAVALEGFSASEKQQISSFISDKGASSGQKIGKVISDTLKINLSERQTFKRKQKDVGERQR